MSPKISLTTVELEDHLNDQLSLLERSCDSFDEGYEAEAKRLAVILRILFHDTKNSKSLLGQLNKLGGQFLDSSFPIDPSSPMTHGGLVVVNFSPPKSRYIAMLDEIPPSNVKMVSFENWWRDPVIVDAKKNQISREYLVRTAADQDGGAHVDPALEEVYYELSKKNSLNWFEETLKEKRAFTGADKGALRQIAHETLKVLKPGYSRKPKNLNGMIIGGVSLVIADPNTVKNSSNTVFPNTGSNKVGRNEKCPCGSGIKFKRCHGQI